MTRISSLGFALLMLTAFGLQSASAQFRIPDIPRIKKPKVEAPRSGGGNDAPADDTPVDDQQPNPRAPADYNANLNVNDMAVAVNRFQSLNAVRIIAKSGNRYKATGVEHPNHTYWYNANSLYPFFDKSEFGMISNDSIHASYLAPYLECYAKKHNLELIKVTGNAFNPGNYNDAKAMKQALQNELPKLAELESMLKSKLQARPNTFLNYIDNPAIWEEITSNRDQYLQCAVGAKESLRVSESVWLRAHMDSIAEKQKQVEAFDPNTKIYLVSASTPDYLMLAVSPRARAEWLSGDSLEFKPNLDPVLDALAAAAAKKLPIYIPNASLFAFHNPLEERMMKGEMGNLAAVKIHQLGLAHSIWQISKNEIGIPTARFKRGYAWVRVTEDHPYCRLYQVNIIQDYAGGGTYGASYAKFLDNTLFGCPAGAR
jgi:hypothetical protein